MTETLSTTEKPKTSHRLDERDCPVINKRDLYTDKEKKMIEDFIKKNPDKVKIK